MLDLPWIFAQEPPPADARLAYGADPSQFGELRLPAGPGPHPVVVLVHGGYWRALYDLAYMGHAGAALAAAGWATWNIEYRRLGNPGGGWPGTFHDLGAATDHLRVLARSYPLDLARMVALGHSAGGHAALWLAGRKRVPPASPLYQPDPLPLRAAVPLAPVADLRLGWELGLSGGVVELLLEGSPDAVPDRYAAANPLELLPLGVPQILIHGTADTDVPIRLSEGYQARAAALGDPARLITLPGVEHFAVVDPRSAVWPQVRAAVQQAMSDER
jgi:acetyl esterase/lipase